MEAQRGWAPPPRCLLPQASVSGPPAAFLAPQPITHKPAARAGPGGRSSGSGRGPSLSGPVSPEEAKCAEGQEASGVRVGELTFPRDSKKQDFLTWDYYLSHVTWPDLLPAIMNSVSTAKTSISWKQGTTFAGLDSEEAGGPWDGLQRRAERSGAGCTCLCHPLEPATSHL